MHQYIFEVSSLFFYHIITFDIFSSFLQNSGLIFVSLYHKILTYNMESSIQIRPSSTPKSQKAFYGVGHILNDLCANCWFSYALLYWTKIVGLSDTDAGLLLLIGQLADAISTIFIGYACDRTKFRWYGKRKLWHLIGCVCVMLSFPFIFNLCINCDVSTTETSKILYYSAFVIIFQFGWAATENSHLALIPEIARRTSDIVHLNAIRLDTNNLLYNLILFPVSLQRTTSSFLVDRSIFILLFQ